MKTIIICLMVPLIIFLFSCGEGGDSGAFIPDIPVYEIKAEEIDIYQEFVGQLYGYKDIAIRARVEGFLEGIHFKEGSAIKKGKLLYTLESQPFEADVAAKMSKVAEAKTVLAYAESDLSRIRPLAAENAVSQSDLDAAVARYDASVASLKAAEANLKAAKIQLSYTKIYSPIDGIIGKTLARVGDFVGKNPNPVILNAVSSIDTVRVEFFITESQYLEWSRYIQKRKDAGKEPQSRSGLELLLADGTVYEHRGKVDFVNREVDPTTGTLLIQASFPNPDGLLRPGLFAKVKAVVSVVQNGVLVPQRCITELQGLYSVMVVGEGNKVDRREVTVGPRIDEFWLVLEGLEPGEKVVYEGLQLVRDGLEVNPQSHKIDNSTSG